MVFEEDLYEVLKVQYNKKYLYKHFNNETMSTLEGWFLLHIFPFISNAIFFNNKNEFRSLMVPRKIDSVGLGNPQRRLMIGGWAELQFVGVWLDAQRLEIVLVVVRPDVYVEEARRITNKIC